MKKIIAWIAAASMALCLIPAAALCTAASDGETVVYETSPVRVASLTLEEAADDGMNMYENSDFIEKEQPELSEETKELISLYQRDPT